MNMKTRKAEIKRKTGETEIAITLDLDGKGKYAIDSGVHFLNHMLELFSRHANFDLTLSAKGDIEVDLHHTVEDIGICLGEAVNTALGDKVGIKRYGTSSVPMDDALATAVVDLSGRPYLVYEVNFGADKVGGFDLELVEEFFRAFSNNCRANIHIVLHHGKNAHHMAEACFKAFARSLSDAVRVDPRITGVLSTKGKL